METLFRSTFSVFIWRINGRILKMTIKAKIQFELFCKWKKTKNKKTKKNKNNTNKICGLKCKNCDFAKERSNVAMYIV